jgi:hypothetical protein
MQNRVSQEVSGSWARLDVYDDFFSDDFRLTFASRQFLIGSDDHSKCIFEVAADFRKGSSLSIYARHFLDEGNIPLPTLLDGRRELTFHVRNSNRNSVG